MGWIRRLPSFPMVTFCNKAVFLLSDEEEVNPASCGRSVVLAWMLFVTAGNAASPFTVELPGRFLSGVTGVGVMFVVSFAEAFASDGVVPMRSAMRFGAGLVLTSVLCSSRLSCVTDSGTNVSCVPYALSCRSYIAKAVTY